ncbi:uncharacterized protein METZ01_LOCUS55746 [marine metagenome]|uniref:Omp28-related outer membrane protein n=1 Tax=marine metagenome TaxID=408172 RepID=A0A381SFN7_9ZZZZ
MMKTLAHLFHIFLLTAFIFLSCGDDNDDDNFYDDWTVTGSGLSAEVSKNALTEFVGSTKCPYCPAADSLLLSYLTPAHENYVGAITTDKWFIINYHTYNPSRGDPMYEFLRGEEAEDDFCYVRFEEGSWYDISGVPTTYTNGSYSYVNENMASGPLSEMTPVQISLAGTTIDGPNIQVRVTISSSSDLTSNNSLYLFIAATLDNVDYEGYNGEKHHQDVFLGWITDGMNGELLSLAEKEKSKSYTWQMPSNWPQNNFETTWPQVEWDAANLQVVAFIQDQSTKEVLQVTGI